MHANPREPRSIPPEIQREIVRQQADMGWPDQVPAYAELPDASGNIMIYRYQELTIALCEQLVERHSRRARALLKKGRFRTRRRLAIARNVVLARLYRCRYIQLTNQQNTTEDDMPFAHNRW